MARSNLSDISLIKDPLMLYNFNLQIPNLPGGGDGYQLMLRCQSATIPGMQIDQVPVDLRGMTLRFAGRHVYQGTYEATYVEARDIKTRTALMRWMYYARDFREGTGNFKDDYATNVDLELFDDKGTTVRTIRLHGAFPINVADLNTESSASTNAVFAVTFSYDYFTDVEDI